MGVGVVVVVGCGVWDGVVVGVGGLVVTRVGGWRSGVRGVGGGWEVWGGV